MIVVIYVSRKSAVMWTLPTKSLNKQLGVKVKNVCDGVEGTRSRGLKVEDEGLKEEGERYDLGK